jgi:hypothetical protein
MDSMPLIRRVVNDESLTRHLGDAEARVLIEWLVDWAELLASDSDTKEQAWEGLQTVCRRARSISRFVELWSGEDSKPAAIQLAGVERFAWPLPAADDEPVALMLRILSWEDRILIV